MRARSRRMIGGPGVHRRAVWLMPLCVLAVHQLRYYLAFGSRADAVLAHEGHAYLAVAEPLALVVTAMAFGGFVGRLAQTAYGDAGRHGRRRAWVRIWLLCALALFAIYCGQELLEGFLSTGHPEGLAGVLGHGGWLAAPVALLVAAVMAAALRVADALVDLRRRDTRALRLPRAALGSALRDTVRDAKDWRLDPRAGVVAGRAPPAVPSLG